MEIKPEDMVADITRDTHFAIKKLRAANLPKRQFEIFKNALEDEWYADVKPYLWR